VVGFPGVKLQRGREAPNGMRRRNWSSLIGATTAPWRRCRHHARPNPTNAVCGFALAVQESQTLRHRCCPGTQFDGSYVAQDTLLSWGGIPMRAQRPCRKVSRFRMVGLRIPSRQPTPGSPTLPVQVFENGMRAGQMLRHTVGGGLASVSVPSYGLGDATRTRHGNCARCHDLEYALRSAAESPAEVSC